MVFSSSSGLGRDYTWGNLILADQQHLQSPNTYTMMAMQLMETRLSLQHGLPTKPEVEAEPVELESADPLGFVRKYLYHG